MALAVVGAIFAIAKYIETTKKNRLPAGVKKLPGPKGLPVIGSVHEVPEKNSWMKFHEWGEQYGPIYQVNLAGQNHVWITRDKVAHDLLSKRSANYSDRPFIPALEQDNRTSGQYLPLMSKNEKWTRQRKFAKQIMDNSAKEAFYGYPELESIRLCFELMTDPSRYNHALESYIARVTCRLAWGTSTAADELKQRARELLVGVSPTGALGNKLPFIMSLPEKWVKAKAWELRRSRTERKFFETMQGDVRQQIDKTSKSPDAPAPILPSLQPKQSWMRTFLENKKAWSFASDLEGAYAVGMHGIAGALTVAAPMQSFCLANCYYPQYQAILHEEVDRVCGDRMPRFSDMPDMPVLRAFIRETLRWRPPVPTGIPHASVKDDVYEGYHIPAGSVMHPLEWSISRDPEVFPDADAWNPMRWLESKYPTYQEPLSKFPTITSYSQFGYGRRTCQGMGVTEADLFVGIGSMAWMFSMHSETEDVEAEAEADKVDALKHAEQKVLRSMHQEISRSSGLTTPPSEDMGHSQLTNNNFDTMSRRLSVRTKRSAIPGNFPTQDTNEDRGITGRASKLAGNPSLPSVNSMFATAPPTPGTQSRDPMEKPSDNKSTKKTHNPSKSADQGEADPTMDYSTLLIAKPKPFKFNLRLRNQEKGDRIARQWMELKMDGEFEDSRVYWEGGNRGNEQFGWGEVTS